MAKKTAPKQIKPRNVYVVDVQFPRDIKLVPGGFTRTAFCYVGAQSEAEATTKVIKHYALCQLVVEVTSMRMAIEQDESEYLSIIQ